MIIIHPPTAEVSVSTFKEAFPHFCCIVFALVEILGLSSVNKEFKKIPQHDCVASCFPYLFSHLPSWLPPFLVSLPRCHLVLEHVHNFVLSSCCLCNVSASLLPKSLSPMGIFGSPECSQFSLSMCVHLLVFACLQAVRNTELGFTDEQL